MHIWVLFLWAQWARWHLLSPVAGAEVRAPRAGPWCPHLPSLIVFPAIVGLGRMSGPGLSPEGLPAGKVWVCWGSPGHHKTESAGRGLSCVAAELNETGVTWPGIG